MEKEFSAWIGNLGKYVGGELQGEWVGFPASPQELEAALARIGGEEQIVFDYDLPEKHGFLREILGEYSSPEELNLLGAALHGLDERELDALAAFADFQGTMTVQELLNAAAQAEEIPYYGYDFEGMENARDMPPEEKYGYTVVEGSMQDLLAELEKYHIKDYLDYEAIGRDAVLSGDVFLYEDGYIQAAEKGPDLSLYDMDGLRAEAIQKIKGTVTIPEETEGERKQDISLPADPAVRNYSYTLKDGKIYFRGNSRMYLKELPAATEERVKGMIQIRDSVRGLIAMQMEADVPDAEIHRIQKELNSLYDAYTSKYGVLGSYGNKRAFSEDSSYWLLCSLEVLDEDGNLERKADMFTKRTIKRACPATSVDTAAEALALSLNEKAGIDLEYMSRLTGKTKE